MERSKSRLKDRLARVFRGSSLLRSACAPSSTASNGGRSLLDDVAKEPVFVPSSRRHLLQDHLQHRSLSFQAYSDNKSEASATAAAAGRLSVDCNDCRPSRVSNLKKKASNSPSKSNVKKSTKKKLLSNPYGFTSSSSEKSEDEFGFFSGDEKEVETDTLFSSKSFSSDVSSFYERPSSKKKKKKKKMQTQENSHGGFRPVVSKKSLGDHKGKKKMVDVDDQEDNNNRVYPVVKKAIDPYADFRSSMVEMIVERHIFSTDELERLLHCYLSLNSHHHEPAILRAFSDICDVLFA